MTALSSLKLSTAQKPTQMPAIQVRRNKLVKRIWEQAEIARAQQAGTTFTAVKFRTIVDDSTGLRRQVEVNKRVKQWWFIADSGKLALSIRYGTKLLELAKGKFAIEIANEKELVSTLEIIKTAVLNGELDAAIEVASNKLKAGFER